MYISSKIFCAQDLPPGYIPEPPVIPQDQVSEAVLNSIGEVPLAELGLCNYTPAGLVQWGLENIHVGLDIPWWGAIAVGTYCETTFSRIHINRLLD